MWTSKSFAALFLLAMTVLACTPPTPQKREDSADLSASFFVERTSVASARSSFSAVSGLPKTRTLSFEACLRDNQLGKAIENHLFKVSAPESNAGIAMTSELSEQSIRSDASGCIRWAEEFSFNYLAKSQWIQLDRIVTAVGFQSGKRAINFAINPWEDKSESLLAKKIPGLLSGPTSQQALTGATAARLILDDLKVTLTEIVIGKVLNLELKTTPQLILPRGENKFTQEIMTTGEFLMDLKLYAVTGGLKKNQIELGKVEKRVMNIRNGVFLNTEPISIELQQLCQNGFVELEMHLTSQNPELSSLKFDGIYNNLGECDQLKGGFFAKLKYSPQLEKVDSSPSEQLRAPLTTQEFIQQSIQSPALGKMTSVPQSQIYINEISHRTIAYQGNPQDRDRKKIFSITACLFRPLDRKPLANQKIHVTKVNGTSEEIETLLSGCLTWDDSLSFNQFESECWIRKSFTLENSILQFRQSRELDINPFADGPESIRDARRGKSDLACGNTNSETKHQLLMQSYEFDMAAEGIRYQTDNYLNLKVQKNGILKIPIKLLKSSFKAVEARIESAAPAGEYILRWAIVDGNIKNFDLPGEKYSGLIYQVQEMKVSIEGSGTLSQMIAIEQADTKSIGNLNTILFEITPVLNADKFLPVTYSGSILVADRKEPGALEALHRGSSLIEKFATQFKKDQAGALQTFKKMATIEFAAQEKKAHLVDLMNLDQSRPLLKDLSTPTLWRQPKDSVLANASPYQASRISEFIAKGKIDSDFEDRLCGVIFLKNMSQKYPRLQGTFSDFYKNCKKSISQTSWIKKDFLYFVKNSEILSPLDFTNEVRALGNGFIVNFAKDYSEAFSMDVNGGVNSGKLLAKITEWISPLSVGGGARYQWSWTERKSEGNAVGTQAVKQLLIEQLPFKMRSTEYEKCLMIRLGRSETTAVQMKVFKELNSVQFIPELYQPILFCDRKIQKKEKVFREQYSVINQLTYGALATNLNSNNARSFFMLLRGASDYHQFVESLTDNLAKPDTPNADFTILHSIDAQFKHIFNGSTRSIPGVYIDTE